MASFQHGVCRILYAYFHCCSNTRLSAQDCGLRKYHPVFEIGHIGLDISSALHGIHVMDINPPSLASKSGSICALHWKSEGKRVNQRAFIAHLSWNLRNDKAQCAEKAPHLHNLLNLAYGLSKINVNEAQDLRYISWRTDLWRKLFL